MVGSEQLEQPTLGEGKSAVYEFGASSGLQHEGGPAARSSTRALAPAGELPPLDTPGVGVKATPDKKLTARENGCQLIMLRGQGGGKEGASMPRRLPEQQSGSSPRKVAVGFTNSLRGYYTRAAARLLYGLCSGTLGLTQNLRTSAPKVGETTCIMRTGGLR